MEVDEDSGGLVMMTTGVMKMITGDSGDGEDNDDRMTVGEVENRVTMTMGADEDEADGDDDEDDGR